MELTYFITDLDRTIIHSKHKGFKCVEMLNGKEITYMTEDSYTKLLKLLKNSSFKFVPCTMRNLNQTMRVDFIREYNPQIIICSNGAQIYINGELDQEWDSYIKGFCDLSKLNENIKLLKGLIDEVSDKIDVLEVRNIEDFYIAIKCLNDEEANKFYNLIKNRFDPELKVMKINAKIFIIHEKIDKIHAVNRIIKLYNITKIVTAGDSEVDTEFTKLGISILPKHSSFRHDHSIVTEKDKIFSTEEILNVIEKLL